MHKLVQLNALSLYLDTRNVRHLASETDRERVKRAMQAMVVRAETVDGAAKRPAEQDHEFVLQPMRASVKAIINDNSNDLSVPKVQATADVDMIDLELERPQYLNVLKVTESLSAYT